MINRRRRLIGTVHRQTPMDSFDDTFACGEVTSTNITPKSNRVGQTSFNVIASKRELMHDQFQIASVCVAIHGPDLSEHRLYVAVWDTRRFLYGSLLVPCNASSIPIDVSNRLQNVRYDRLYYFEINLDLLGSSWCSIMTPHPVDGKTDCVLRLKEFELLEEGDEP